MRPIKIAASAAVATCWQVAKHGALELGDARRCAWTAAHCGHPFGTARLPPTFPSLPPPSLKASGELQEKVPRVYTHMRRPSLARAGRREDVGGLGLCGEDSRRLVFVSVFAQSLPTYICIVTLYGNNVCDHSARYPAATSFNRSLRFSLRIKPIIYFIFKTSSLGSSKWMYFIQKFCNFATKPTIVYKEFCTHNLLWPA